MRIRIIFKKTEPMRYTSHLDLHRAWERTIRRANLPLAYSKGYHPQPKINLASALPLGITSDHELADIWFEEDLDLFNIKKNLVSSLPPGIEIHSLNKISENEPSLQSTLTSALYHVTLLDEIDKIEERVNAIREAPAIIRVRRGKKYNLRPLIEEIALLDERHDNHQILMMKLTALEGATGRPDEVLDECSIDPSSVKIRRIKLLFRNNTSLLDPN